MFVYCYDTVAHTVKQNTWCQTAEIIYLPAPNQNNHTWKHDPQHKRRRIIHENQLHNVWKKCHHWQRRKHEYQHILSVMGVIRLFHTYADQRIQRQRVRYDRTAQHKKPIARPVLQTQITVPFRSIQPVYTTIIKCM